MERKEGLMDKYYCVTDADGFYKDLVLAELVKDESGAEVEQFYHHEPTEGDSLVLVTDERRQPTLKVYVGAPGYIRPRWNGTVWIEGATHKERVAWELEHPAPPPPPPDPVDVLGTQVAQLTLDNMQLNQFINVMGPELAQTKLELMSLKTAEGGVTDGVLETGL